MTKQDYADLFNMMHPGFFELEHIKRIPETAVCEEMVFPLNEFDPKVYDRKPDCDVTFGYFDGDYDKLKRDVYRVADDWVDYFNKDERIYCAFINGEAVSFCIVDDMGEYTLNGKKIKIGGPGCVGTVPEYRNRGIGLNMINNATEILRDEGFDYSWIHYTGVSKWYAKLGYKTVLKWNGKGIIQPMTD